MGRRRERSAAIAESRSDQAFSVGFKADVFNEVIGQNGKEIYELLPG